MAPTRFRLIGRFAVEAGGQPIPDTELGNRKARLLLKLLAARRGRHVPMDTILDALWGDELPAKAVENVASLASRLRGVLGPDALDGGRSGYRLVIPPRATVDIDDAARLVEESENRLSGEQPALAATAAARALELLDAGTALEEETAEAGWLDELRRDLDRLTRRARVSSWRASAALGEHRQALAMAQQAVSADPLDEEAHRAVILAYYRLGESGEALAAYERVRKVLVDELGADPGAETQALYLAVLRGEGFVDDATGPRGERRQPLVGRETELASLVARWEEASQGSPSCVLAVGDAGIGKTRLVEALLDDVRAAGAIVVMVRCYESESSLFLQPVVDVLRELVSTLSLELVSEAAEGVAGPLATLVPELAHLPEAAAYERVSAEMERRRAFEAIACFLAAVSKRRPLLVAFDDLHNAGASSAELLHFVLRWDRTARLLLAATVQRDRGAEVAAVLGDRAVSVAVGPLSEGAVVQLAREAGHPALGVELFQLTNGHTMFVVEALQAASDAGVAIPASLRSAVVDRVARCGAPIEEFLRGAVVAGSVFDVEHVAEMLGVSGEEAVRLAESALRAGLLRVAGAGYEFANAVIREVLYDTTPMPTRVMRHRRLAALLRDRPAEAAEHAAAAGDRETAVDQWLIAGEAALAVFANREAEAMLTRALDACTLMVDPVRTARVQLLRGRARLNQTRYEDAELDLAGAQALARAIGDAGLEQSALEQLGWCAYYARQIERAGELAERALRQPAASARTQVLAGRLRHARGDLSGAIETLSAVAEEATDAALRASATSYLSSVLAHSGRFDEAVPMLDDAADACRLAGLLRPMFNALFFSTMARANRGDLGGALTAVRTLAAEVERYEYHAYRPRTLNLRSWLRRELGDAVHAQDLAQQGLEATLLPDGYVEAEPAAHSRLQLAESALQVGDVADAARWLAELADTGLAGVAFGWRVELHWLEVEARLESARAEELLARADERGSLKYRALALAHMGRRSEALEVASATGSALLVAHVADDEVARRAAESVAATLPVEDRNQFMEQGAWRGAMT